MTPAVESNFVIGAVVTLVLTAVASLSVRQPRARSVLVLIGLTLTLVGLFLALAVRWIREDQGPFLTLYDVLLSNLFSLGLIYLFAIAVAPVFRATTSTVLLFLGLLGFWLLSVPAEAVQLPASFDNPWLWLHVISGKLFLGICLLAAAAATLLLLNRFAATQIGAVPDARAPDLEAAIWPTISAAFVCHSFMLVAGAVWAHSAWGRYWAWDPLETWSFVTWLCMALLLHARATYRRMPAAIAWGAVVGVFLLAVATFLGVPFVSMAPHKGVL